MWEECDVKGHDSATCEFEVFYDGGCPLCRREVEWLRRRSAGGKFHFTDISDPAFRAAAVGKTDEELMARIHGRLSDGTWLQGVEVFRRLYSAIGFGPLVFLSRLPVISPLLAWGYALFARNRLRLTGRCTAQGCAAKRGSGPGRSPDTEPA